MDNTDGLIFDFDGFLADSEKFHFKTYAETFAKYGHHVDETEYYKYWTSLGHGAKGEVERHNLDLDPIQIRDEKREVFSKYCEDGSIKLFPEAEEMIERFAATGKRMSIASGTPRPDIVAILRNAGRLDAFEIIVGSDMSKKVKPDPTVFNMTLEALDLPADKCLVFEDAEKGVEAANRAGIPVVVVLTEETKTFEFEGADLVLDSHPALLDALRALG